MSATAELAWHFLRVSDGVPVLRDGVTPAPAIGEWLEHKGSIVACQAGLHASRRAADALEYLGWDSGVACLVECEGIEAEEADKIVCRRRRIVAAVLCDDILRIFAREVALSVAHLWEMPPVVRQYLETGDEKIRAAAAYAAAAVRAAANAAYAAYAANDAAAYAANAAYAAGAAAYYAAYAVRAAAAYAVRAAAAYAAAADDADDAAYDDAAYAARAAQNTLLESLLLGEMGL